jgi:hypothetical protein
MIALSLFASLVLTTAALGLISRRSEEATDHSPSPGTEEG